MTVFELLMHCFLEMISQNYRDTLWVLDFIRIKLMSINLFLTDYMSLLVLTGVYINVIIYIGDHHNSYLRTI